MREYRMNIMRKHKFFDKIPPSRSIQNRRGHFPGLDSSLSSSVTLSILAESLMIQR